jgi:hypothetical protein
MQTVRRKFHERSKDTFTSFVAHLGITALHELKIDRAARGPEDLAVEILNVRNQSLVQPTPSENARQFFSRVELLGSPRIGERTRQ